MLPHPEAARLLATLREDDPRRDTVQRVLDAGPDSDLHDRILVDRWCRALAPPAPSSALPPPEPPEP